MTIAITLKVNDGVVLAADSATTLARGPNHANVYNNANKIINLVKGLPIGVATWGLGSIGPSSIATLLKDLRRELRSELQPVDADWPDYDLGDVADQVHRFFTEHHSDAFGKEASRTELGLGFFVVGYSSNAPVAEEYRLQIGGPTPFGVQVERDTPVTGVSWAADYEALQRLIGGFDPRVLDYFRAKADLDDGVLQAAARDLADNLGAGYVQSAMPMQDAIDLARWLAEVAVMHRRFTLGYQTVGGPVEIAAVTKHEGFKWVQRKLYFDHTMNPEG